MFSGLSWPTLDKPFWLDVGNISLSLTKDNSQVGPGALAQAILNSPECLKTNGGVLSGVGHSPGAPAWRTLAVGDTMEAGEPAPAQCPAGVLRDVAGGWEGLPEAVRVTAPHLRCCAGWQSSSDSSLQAALPQALTGVCRAVCQLAELEFLALIPRDRCD